MGYANVIHAQHLVVLQQNVMSLMRRKAMYATLRILYAVAYSPYNTLLTAYIII